MHFIYLISSIITPFALGLLLVIGMKYNISKEIKFCTTKVTNLQHSHRRLTKSLISKNPYAKWLRRSRRITSKAARLDPTRISLAALLATIVAQKTLRTYQQGLILTAQLQYQKLQANMLSKGYFPTGGFGGLAVQAYPLYSASPSYRLKSQYQTKKKIRFTKLVNSKNRFHFLIKNIKGINKIFKFNCGATMLKKGRYPSDIKLLLDR